MDAEEIQKDKWNPEQLIAALEIHRAMDVPHQDAHRSKHGDRIQAAKTHTHHLAAGIALLDFVVGALPDAALMNWGRAPTTVSSFNVIRPPGRPPRQPQR